MDSSNSFNTPVESINIEELHAQQQQQQEQQAEFQSQFYAQSQQQQQQQQGTSYQQQHQQQQQQQSQQQQQQHADPNAEFNAHAANFAAMSIDDMIDYLTSTTAASPISTEAEAFLYSFAQRMLQQKQEKEAAEQQAATLQSEAQNATAAAQFYQQQYQAAQAAGQGTGGVNNPNVPPTSNPHMSQQQPTQQGMNVPPQMSNNATLGGQTRLGQALSKGIKPPTFDGSRVIDWCFRITQYLHAIDEHASEQDKVKFAVNLLTGKALTWWRHKLSTESVQYNTLDDLLRDLYNQFVDADLVNKLREQLDSLTQSKGQSVQKYITRFKEIQIELGPYALGDEAARYKFIKGLQPQLRLFTNMARPQTLREACEIAATNESSLNGTMSIKPHGVRDTTVPMDLGTFQAAGPKHQNRRSSQQNNRNATRGKNPQQNRTSDDSWKKNATCHYCGKKGHIKPDCRSFARSKGKQPNTTSRASLSVAEQLAQITAQLNAMQKPSSSKN